MTLATAFCLPPGFLDEISEISLPDIVDLIELEPASECLQPSLSPTEVGSLLFLVASSSLISTSAVGTEQAAA